MSFVKSKKLNVFLIIIFIITAVFVWQFLGKNQAEAIDYGEMYSSGDIIIASDGDDSFNRFSASSIPAYDYTATLTGTDMPMATSFLPNGDLLVYHLNNTIRCFTKGSNYVGECSWSPYVVSANDYINPVTGAITETGSDVLSGITGFGIIVSHLGDLWLAHTGFDYSGRYVSRTTASSGYTDTIVYDVSFGGVIDYAPIAAVPDHNGDIWVASWYNESNINNNKVYCLDYSNNYRSCAGAAFDANGGITVPDSPFMLAVDSENNIFMTHFGGGDRISKIKRSDFSVTTTEVTGNIESVRYLTIDSNDNIWITGEWYVPFDNGRVKCYQNDDAISECGPFMLVYDIGEDWSGGIFTDKNDDIWVVQTDDNRLYCWDSSNSYNACQGDNFNTDVFGAAYLITASLTKDIGANMGSDPTGKYIYNLCVNSGGCGSDIVVDATVDPTISFDIVNYTTPANDTSTCALGTLTPNTLATCQYRVGVGSNAGRGFTLYITDSNPSSAGLRSSTYQLTNVTDNTVGPGPEAEEYGFIISSVASGLSASGTFDSEEQAVPISNIQFISSTGPFNYVKGTANQTSVVDHKVITKATTPAGYYTQTIRYTVTGNF